MPESARAVIATLTGLVLAAYGWMFRRHVTSVDDLGNRIRILEMHAAVSDETDIDLDNKIDHLRQTIDSYHEENREDHKEILNRIMDMLRR